MKPEERIQAKAGTPRRAWIDCARGIAIILVVLGHSDMGDHPLCKWLSSFHIPLFFVISGMLLGMRGAYDGMPLRRILARRAAALLYPYLTFSALTLLYSALLGRFSQMERLLRYTLTLEGVNTLWFLPTMLFSECLFFLLRRSGLKSGLCAALIFLGTSAYSALQFYALGGGEPAEAGMLYQVLNGCCRAGIGYLFLMAGFAGAKLAPRLAQVKREKLIAASVLALFVGAACGMINDMVDYHYSVLRCPLLSYPAALLQSCAVIALCALCIRRCAPLEYLGRNSLIVMATHYLLPLISAAAFLVSQVSSGIRYVDTALICALTLLFEVPVIWLIRRVMPFMLRWPARAK